MFLAHCPARSLRVRLLLLLTFLLGAYEASAAEPLLWKFKVGDTHPFRLSQVMKMDMDIGSIGKVEASLQQTTDLVWTVESVAPNGSASLLQKVRRIHMEMNAPGQTQMRYDSDSKEPPTGYGAMLVPMMKTLMGSQIVIQLSARGKILSLEIPEKLSETMDRVPGTKLMGDLASEKGLRNMIQNVVMVLPETDDLQVGQPWNQTVQMEHPVYSTVTCRTSYEYKGPREVEAETMEVFAPTIEISYENAELPDGGKLTVLNQKSEGEILFNRTLGRLNSTVLTNVALMQIESAGQTIRQTINQTVKVTRLDVKATQPESPPVKSE